MLYTDFQQEGLYYNHGQELIKIGTILEAPDGTGTCYEVVRVGDTVYLRNLDTGALSDLGAIDRATLDMYTTPSTDRLERLPQSQIQPAG
ncbi:hypothetical protein KGQ71_00205 [Patescibacteria group bacterium]|nr:hypothetical protein [Patescibacteria group bacterium]